jgi:hypothetical protein
MNKPLYFVVLSIPFTRIRGVFEPLLILRNSEKIFDLFSLPDLETLFNISVPETNGHHTNPDNRRHELNQKIGNLQQRRIKMVQEVDQETFNM